MKAVVVAAGDLVPGDLAWLEAADLVVAADGGVDRLAAVDRVPDLVVGDLDSADAGAIDRLEAAGARIERHPADKDASDTELAVRAALDAGASSLVLIGATGGRRLDHELANLLLLADPLLASLDARIVRGETVVRAVTDGEALDLEAQPGTLVTLLPLGGETSGVSTTGLRWPLDRATLAPGRSRGLSNEVATTPASVRVERGTLLVVETSNQGASLP